jgi:diaminohydroxyphosphoribosylaminopyrimidine deaminase/5-amino-6-(5-phosphoribosylamino)uracil reductase
MRHALRLGALGLGECWPNPSVGCVIVAQGRVVGAARTGERGRPHAETQALAQAGQDALGATVYVTLEPCAHHGTTPPCADALIKAGVARVVMACLDPDPRTAGQGLARLRKAGLAVETEVCAADAAAQHRGFFRRVNHGLPEAVMKIASSLDGHCIDHAGKSQWITGEAARAHGHGLRAKVDAVVTGIGTVLADDPMFTCRLPGLESRSPIRVVLDTQLRIPLSSQLVSSARSYPTWVITTARGVEEAASHVTELREHGVKLLVADHEGRVPPRIALSLLAAEGITRVLVEAGPQLSAAFLDAHVVSTLYWYRGSMLLGGNAISALAARTVSESPRQTLTARLALGPDHLDVYEIAPCLPD